MNPRIVRQVFRNRCPRCDKAPVFRGFTAMNEACPGCGYRYAREPGYFLGAMVFSYLLGCFSIIPTVILGWFVFHLDIFAIVAIASAQVVVLAPFLFRFSRLAWIVLDFRADPDQPR